MGETNSYFYQYQRAKTAIPACRLEAGAAVYEFLKTAPPEPETNQAFRRDARPLLLLDRTDNP
jgi:hypothetical protein